MERRTIKLDAAVDTSDIDHFTLQAHYFGFIERSFHLAHPHVVAYVVSVDNIMDSLARFPGLDADGHAYPEWPGFDAPERRELDIARAQIDLEFHRQQIRLLVQQGGLTNDQALEVFKGEIIDFLKEPEGIIADPSYLVGAVAQVKDPVSGRAYLAEEIEADLFQAVPSR